MAARVSMHGFGQRRSLGFTLIELLVVVVVMGVVAAAVVAGVGNIRGASVQSESSKLAIAVRYLYNLSVLSGRNHRLVVDLDTGSYWGEEQASSDPCESFLLPSQDELDGGDKAAAKEAEDGTGSTNKGFHPTESRLLAKYTLDKGLSFAGVMTSHQTELAERGQAYVYFFPNGTTENAVIYVEGDEDDVMSVEVLALQGTARLHNDKLSLDDFAKFANSGSGG